MTKHERAEVEKAIRELMDDEPKFSRAIGRLCKLIGWRYPASEVKLRPIPLHELLE